jgi:hypothetical protein
MGSGKTQLGDVLDRDHPLPHRDGGGQDVEQCDIVSTAIDEEAL